MPEIERLVCLAASPSDVEASLIASPWRAAVTIEPAGSGTRVRISARVEPEGLAAAVEELVLADVCRLHGRSPDRSHQRGPEPSNRRTQ